MSTNRVIIISGLVSYDLKAASKILSYFLSLNCQIQSTNLFEERFLYTLTRPQGFFCRNNDHLNILQGIQTSTDFSVNIA